MIDIDKRMHEIVGQPPRIEPLDTNQITDEQKQMVLELWKAIGIPPKDELPEFFATMLRHPQLMIAHTAYATQLLKSELTPRHRQLAIIRMGWLCQAPYEWSQHLKNGKNNAGLTTEDAENVIIGPSAEGWVDEDRLIMQAVQELYENAMIADKTWADLAKFLNEKQLLELPLLIGFYQSVAYLQNALRFRLMPGSEGLKAR